MRWFDRQPYSLPEKILQGPVTGMMLGHLLAELLKALLCLALVSLPVLAAWFGIYRELSRSALTRIAFLLTALAIASFVLHTRGELEHRVMPWLGHVIGTQSIFPSTGEMIGSRPVTCPSVS
jgi:hypothetical protein